MKSEYQTLIKKYNLPSTVPIDSNNWHIVSKADIDRFEPTESMLDTEGNIIPGYYRVYLHQYNTSIHLIVCFDENLPILRDIIVSYYLSTSFRYLLKKYKIPLPSDIVEGKSIDNWVLVPKGFDIFKTSGIHYVMAKKESSMAAFLAADTEDFEILYVLFRGLYGIELQELDFDKATIVSENERQGLHQEGLVYNSIKVH